MKKTLLLIILFFASFTASMAQSKMNFSLARNAEEKETNENQQVSMLIQGNVSQIKVLVTKVGGKFKYSTGNIASVSLSLNQLSQIISDKAILRVEAFPPSIHPLNDSMLVNANIIPVHNGTAPFSQIYDGTGVIVGFIDTGIDITHADFKDALGKTRILWLWDQTKTTGGTTPAIPLNYGQEWDNTAIDGGLAVSHTDPSGHGTHVAGVGVANGLATATANFNGKGVAPKADIIFVALDFTNVASNNTIVDAVKYIYDKAFAAGKPCVINVSLGADYGLHDGRDLESQSIKSLINQKTGQAFVAAAGNSGSAGKCHLTYTVSATDTNFTLFAPTGGNVYIDIVADSSDLVNIDFAIGADKMTAPHSFRGNIPFITVSSIPVQVPQTTFLKNASNQQIGRIDYYLDTVNGDYDLQIYITPDSTTYNWRLMATGSGSFDLWNYTPSSLYTPIVSSIPTITTPDSIYYKYPDADKSIQGGFQCLDEVVAVGNYQNRQSYIDCNNNPFVNPALIVGELVKPPRVLGSSIGPTRDGRIKPDIVAPGDMTMAALSAAVPAGLRPPDKVAEGCKHFRSGGTSHSSPVVAGVAALYLQKNPTATAMQVQQAIIRCPIQDQYTGSCLPNKYWGYGKINGFGTLAEMLTTTQPSDKTVCDGSNAIFTTVASGTGLSYQWVILQGGTCVNLTNVAPYSGVTTNTLTITAAANGLNGNQYRCIVSNAYSCDVTSASAILTVNPLPTVTASASANTVCAGNILTLTGNGATSHIWTGGAVNAVAFASPAIPTTYTVVGTDGNGCKDTTTIAIQVNALPVVTATASVNTVCIGSTVTLTGAGAATHLWTGGITDGLSFTPTLGATTYTVTGTDLNNCVNSDQTTITVTALPIVTSSGLDTNYCIDATTATLTGTPTGGTFSGTGITNGAAGTFDPVTAGSGTVTITYTYTDGNNCSGISTQSTTVLTPAVSADSCPTLIPPGMDSNISNIFTPNNDGINDEFKVSYNGVPASDFNLSIFNRWGIPVFTSNNPYVKWDGRTTSGIKVSAGTYFYVLVNAGINYKGYIALFD